jgi:16S rRNA (guanine966-N2)-methyltransferase
MLDRVREALFSTLTPWLAGARVLDLFAGSGSLGLEALSRGAAHGRLVESHAAVLERLRANVEELGLTGRVELVRGDALAPASWGGPASADVVLFDPPYPMLDDPATRALLLGALARLVEDVLLPEGVAVLHAPAGKLARADLPDVLVRERSYGTNALWYLQREEEQ